MVVHSPYMQLKKTKQKDIQCQREIYLSATFMRDTTSYIPGNPLGNMQTYL